LYYHTPVDRHRNLANFTPTRSNHLLFFSFAPLFIDFFSPLGQARFPFVNPFRQSCAKHHCAPCHEALLSCQYHNLSPLPRSFPLARLCQWSIPYHSSDCKGRHLRVLSTDGLFIFPRTGSGVPPGSPLSPRHLAAVPPSSARSYALFDSRPLETYGALMPSPPKPAFVISKEFPPPLPPPRSSDGTVVSLNHRNEGFEGL